VEDDAGNPPNFLLGVLIAFNRRVMRIVMP
jgi:hypothetical protein